MIRKSLITMGISAIALWTSGCMSFYSNLSVGAKSISGPYAGVRTGAAQLIEESRGEPAFDKFTRGVLITLDMPLSAAFDTLLLPLSIPAAVSKLGSAFEPRQNPNSEAGEDEYIRKVLADSKYRDDLNEAAPGTSATKVANGDPEKKASESE